MSYEFNYSEQAYPATLQLITGGSDRIRALLS